jgi:hypothetical protein
VLAIRCLLQRGEDAAAGVDTTVGDDTASGDDTTVGEDATAGKRAGSLTVGVSAIRGAEEKPAGSSSKEYSRINSPLPQRRSTRKLMTGSVKASAERTLSTGLP